jgi:hypothetical protein
MTIESPIEGEDGKVTVIAPLVVLTGYPLPETAVKFVV